MNNVSKCVLTFLLLVGSITASEAQSFVTENDRPDATWIEHFKKAKTVKVNTSIEEALHRCPDNQYCNVMLPTLTLLDTVQVARSRTAFIGMNNSKINAINEFHGFYFQLQQGVQEVLFTGLTINGDATQKSPDVFGIGAYDSSVSRIAIIANNFLGLFGRDNAHAIAFYGTGKNDQDAIEHVTIAHNRISDLRTGSSESIAMNGNVRHWSIRANTIERINNIAIDVIGGEGTAPVQVLADGRTAPGPFDAARLGFIENNSITGLSTKSNPAYGSETSWAAAIYVDGGHSIKISGNTLLDIPWGLAVGAENCVRASHVEILDNQSNNSTYGDVLIGGYAKGGYLEDTKINCDPHTSEDQSEGHGYVDNVVVRNNRLKSRAIDSELFLGNTVLQYRYSDSTIEAPVTKLNP